MFWLNKNYLSNRRTLFRVYRPFVKLLLREEAGPAVQFSFEDSSTVGQAKQKIEEAMGKKVTIYKYAVVENQLSQELISEYQAVKELIWKEQLCIKINNQIARYELAETTGFSLAQRIVRQTLAESVKQVFVSKSIQGAVKATSLPVLLNDALRGQVFAADAKRQAEQIYKILQERRRILQLMELKVNEQKAKQDELALRPLRLLTNLSIVQFAGLFYITYGLYGWDVGEPVSYLLGLGVDLAVIMLLLMGKPSSRTAMMEEILQKLKKRQSPQVELNRRIMELEDALQALHPNA